MARTEKRPPLSDAQLEIMNVVWDRGEATVAQVRQELCRRRQVARNTVQTMMTRLEEAGWLKHRTEGITFWYAAVASRKTAVQGMVRRLADAAFDGSTAGMVMALLDGQTLADDEARRIEEMIARAKRNKRGTSRRSKS